MAKMRGIKRSALAILERRHFSLDLSHANRIASQFYRFAKEGHFHCLGGRHGGIRQDECHSPKAIGSSQLPCYRSVRRPYGEGSAVSSLDELKHSSVSGVHTDSYAWPDVVLTAPLARDVNTTFAHEKANELVVDLVKFHASIIPLVRLYSG